MTKKEREKLMGILRLLELASYDIELGNKMEKKMRVKEEIIKIINTEEK